ncbi:MAG: HD domain-containing protein [Bacilli bacterium]|nr:HD domain-containing protein [Bacilli bacterium]
MYKEYLKELGRIPSFLKKYLELDSLIRLKKVSYLCGMDYASDDIYDFREYISRFDHSLDVALITYKLTKDKKATLAGLFHDISTPCFSHVIDYMNKDYSKQESTEEYTERVLKSDKKLLKYLDEDNIDINDIINFKKYTVVDNDRPKLCADRLDGVILSAISWTKDIEIDEIKRIINNIKVFDNEKDEKEIGFCNLEIAKLVLEKSNNIDIACHSDYDNYMMELLAEITRFSIKNKYISYEDLYIFDEETLYNKLKKTNDIHLEKLIYKFENITMEEIIRIKLPDIKKRDLNPLVNGIRLKTIIDD